jgi:hypothetical protein
LKYLAIICLICLNSCIGIILGQSNNATSNTFDSAGKDTINAINSHSNSLYTGMDNYIEINRKKIPYKNIIVECERGMAMEDEDSYLVYPSKPGIAIINIYEYDHNDTNLVLKKAMKVFATPQPYVTLDNLKISDLKYLTRDKFKKSSHLQVHLSEDFINDSTWYQIKEITFGYPVGQQYITLSSEGGTLSNEMLDSISKMMPGKEMSFTFTLEGEGGLFKRLSPIRIKIY